MAINWADPSIWVALAIVVFIIAVWRPVGRSILTTLDSHAAQVAKALQEAEQLRHQAESLLSDAQSKYAAATLQAQDMVAQAKLEADRLAKDNERELNASLERRERQAVERIARAESQALTEMKTMAVDLAVTAAKRIMRDSLDAKKSADVIDRAIQDLPKRLN
ncbi:MAG: F0F1 ATP synthase subunit B [Dongiaceae bacterium]